MKTQINLEQAKGKTLLGHAFTFDDVQLILVFSDDTYAAVGIFSDYREGDHSLYLLTDPVDFDNYDPNELDQLGVQTKEERHQIALEREAKNKQRAEAHEKLQLAELIKKYGVPK